MSRARLFLLVFLLSLVASVVSAGDYIVIDDSGDLIPLGNSGGNQVMVAQSFKTVDGGNFNSFKFTYGTNTGSPVGDIEWSLRSDFGGKPGTIIKSLPTSPIATATVTITVAGNVTDYLSPNTSYWIVFQAQDQSAGNSYNLVGGELSDYVGKFATSTNNGTTWTTTDDTDLAMTVTLLDPTDNPSIPIFGDEGLLRIDDLITYMEQALGYLNSLPDSLTSYNGTEYLPSETASQLMGYAKWLFSFNTAQEILGVSLAPIGVNLYILLSIIIILAITWALIKIIVLIIRFVQYIARWIIDLIPGT